MSKNLEEVMKKANEEADRSILMAKSFRDAVHPDFEHKFGNPWHLVDKFDDPTWGPMLHYQAYEDFVMVRMHDGQPIINYAVKDKPRYTPISKK